MRVLAVIPSRYASSRFPGKPLIDIKGKPMIQWVYESAQKAQSISKLVIATDDQRIFDAAKSFGAEVVMTSPDHLNGTERCAEVARNEEVAYDVVINIQGDEPFIKAEQIDQLAACFENEEVQIATLIKPLNDTALINNPSIIKVTRNKSNKALYFSRAPIPYLRDENKHAQFYKHIGMYAYHPRVLQQLIRLEPSPLELTESLEQLRWLENGYDIHVAETNHESDSIDTPDDLKRLLTKHF